MGGPRGFIEISLVYPQEIAGKFEHFRGSDRVVEVVDGDGGVGDVFEAGVPGIQGGLPIELYASHLK
jgi:hypothetical protein